MPYIKINSEGRITAASKTHHCGKDEIEVIIPNEIVFETIHEYRFVDGEFIHDPKPVEVIEVEPTMEQRLSTLEEENKQLKEALDLLLSGTIEEVDTDG